MIDLYDFSPQHQRGGVGIVISEAYQHKGIASIALDIFIKYAFNRLNLHQLYADISVNNLHSKQLFIKNNFQFNGIKKDWINQNKSFIDVEIYQLINKNKKQP